MKILLFKKRFLSRRSLKFALPTVVGVLALTFLILELTNTIDLIKKSPITETAPSGTAPSSTETSDPATAAKNPNSISNDAESFRSNSSGQKTKVYPEITYAGQEALGQPVVVSAFIPRVYEDGGTCRAILTQGSYKVSQSSLSFKNVSYTTCRAISIPRSNLLISGNWLLIVDYESSTSEGSSSAHTVRVE